MPTNNPRINITFEESTAGLLSYIAQQEHKPPERGLRLLTKAKTF